MHVSDVVNAIIASLKNERARGVYNVGGRAVTINQLADLIIRLAGREGLKPVRAPPRLGDIRHSVADITRARRKLGFEPRMRLEMGVAELLEAARCLDRVG